MKKQSVWEYKDWAIHKLNDGQFIALPQSVTAIYHKKEKYEWDSFAINQIELQIDKLKE